MITASFFVPDSSSIESVNQPPVPADYSPPGVDREAHVAFADMIVYHLSAIDSWRGWLAIDAAFGYDDPYTCQRFSPESWPKIWAEASRLAAHVGWEGDILEGPYISALPAVGGRHAVVVAWRQHNNGDTFLAAPYRLPWIEREADGFASRETVGGGYVPWRLKA